MTSGLQCNTLEEQVNNPSDIVPPSLTKAPCYNNNQLASLIHVPHVQCIPTQPYNHQSDCIVSKPTILEALHRSTNITTANCASLPHKLYFVITTSLTRTQTLFCDNHKPHSHYHKPHSYTNCIL